MDMIEESNCYYNQLKLFVSVVGFWCWDQITDFICLQVLDCFANKIRDEVNEIYRAENCKK